MKTAKKLIFFSIYWIIYYGLIAQWVIGNPILQYLPDVIIMYLGILFWNRKPKVSYVSLTGKYIVSLIFVFCFVGVLSGILNRESPLSWLWGLRNYARYTMLFMVMYKLFDLKDLLKVKKIFQRGLTVNLIYVLFQFYVLGMRGDPIGGTFSGGNSALVTFMVPSLLLLLGDYFQKRVSTTSLVLHLAGIMFFAIVGEVKFVYFILPVMLYGSYVIMRKFSVMHIVVLVLSFFFLIPTYKYLISFYYGEKYVDRIFTAEYLEHETTSDGFGSDFNRSTVFEQSSIYITNTPMYFAVGHGFGASSTSALFESNFARENWLLFYYYFSVPCLLADAGWIGLSIFVIIHLLLFFRFLHFYWRYSRYKDIRYWSGIGVISIPVQFLMMWYNNGPVLQAYSMTILWTLIFIYLEYRTKIGIPLNK